MTGSEVIADSRPMQVAAVSGAAGDGGRWTVLDSFGVMLNGGAR